MSKQKIIQTCALAHDGRWIKRILEEHGFEVIPHDLKIDGFNDIADLIVNNDCLIFLKNDYYHREIYSKYPDLLGRCIGISNPDSVDMFTKSGQWDALTRSEISFSLPKVYSHPGIFVRKNFGSGSKGSMRVDDSYFSVGLLDCDNSYSTNVTSIVANKEIIGYDIHLLDFYAPDGRYDNQRRHDTTPRLFDILGSCSKEVVSAFGITDGVVSTEFHLHKDNLNTVEIGDLSYIETNFRFVESDIPYSMDLIELYLTKVYINNSYGIPEVSLVG